jgi:hypothetical protein
MKSSLGLVISAMFEWGAYLKGFEGEGFFIENL